MPVIKSAKKRARQAEKRRKHNLSQKRALKKAIKDFQDAIEVKDKQKAKEQLNEVFSKLDKAVKNNQMHKNTVARRKSSYARQLQALEGSKKKSSKSKKKK